jgi:hypothetical protein
LARKRTAAYGSMNFLILRRAIINNYNSSGLNGQIGPLFGSVLSLRHGLVICRACFNLTAQYKMV